MKSKYIYGIGIFLIIILVIVIIYLELNRKEYILNLPKVQNIASINMIYGKENYLISDASEIFKIYDAIISDGRKTKKPNKEEYQEYIQVEFNYEEEVAAIVRIFTKKNKYYLEQSNNGIYELNKEDYNTIKSYFKNSI